MNKKFYIVYVVINILLIIAVGGFLIYTLWKNGEVPQRRIVESVLIIGGCLFNMIRYKQRKPKIDNYKRYEDAYQEILTGAFSEDRKSYQKLLEASACFAQDKLHKGHKILDKLEKKCIRSRDYVAVYTFKALCYEWEGKMEQSIVYYQKVLQYDMTNSLAWSNLGIRYKEMGKVQEAYDAYSNAILYDPKDAYAYSNMACFLVDIAEPQKALEYALKSVELNANVSAAMGAAALALKMLGDDINAEKFCKMYGMNGGNVNVLRQRMAAIEKSV